MVTALLWVRRLTLQFPTIDSVKLPKVLLKPIDLPLKKPGEIMKKIQQKKRRHYNRELQRWQADSTSTATWLCHLVFSSGPSPLTPTHGTQRLKGPKVATVVDYNSDEGKGVTKDKVSNIGSTNNVITTPQNGELIVWNKTTEPSIAVDRLLTSWTNLFPIQIEESVIGDSSIQDETWTDALVQRLQDYQKEETRNGKKESNLSIRR
ncbi:hypothetical protein K469DRAFT_308234 [Zopfia rhizophila CBS 207.26]|uniref:Uncharacterized protein n=1 Tax=Zopfia rhizophila CBS 207.26 TaxID=1314779 RepID=A0A6A6EKY9_9PEZI|nr:hypothetical protein K469DRAFT_308234 [Zopfia rhizophila CBS 207.26]